MSPPTAREREFVEYLQSLVDREACAALAALRRGLGKAPGSVPDLYPYVVPWVPEQGPPWHEEIYYLVSALFALYPENWSPEDDHEPTNLGASFRRLADSAGSASTERRFIALLNAARDDLPEHLRHAIALLKAHEIPVDWAELLHDLRDWEHEDRPVQRRWARAFWREPPGSVSSPESTTAPAVVESGA
jgi:CRISPR system Cascade subunit CasB